MRIVLAEDIPEELAPPFAARGDVVDHVAGIGLRGAKNSQLLAAISGRYDVLVTGDTNLEYQQNFALFDIAVVLIRPRRLVIE